MALVPGSILKNFFIYASGSALLKCISLALIPLLLRVVPPYEYGILALAMSCAGITSHILDLGLRQYLLIDYFKRTTRERLQLILDIALFYAIISIPLLVLFCLIVPRFFSNQHAFLLVLFIALHVFFSFFAELFYQVLRNEQKVLFLTTLQSSVTIGTMLFNIALASYFHTGALGILFGYITGLASATIVGSIWFWAQTRKHTDVFTSLAYHCGHGYRYLPFSIPLMPSTLLNWVFSSGDKWILALYATLTDVGIYALGDTVGLAYHMLIIYPLNSSYIPYLLERYASGTHPLKELERHNKKIMVLTMILLTFGSLTGYWIGKPLLYWALPAHYHPVIPYLPLLLIGYTILTGTYFLSALIQFHNKRTFLAYSLVVPALVNIGLNRLLVPHYKLYGSLYATITAYALYFMGMLWYNIRLTKQLTYQPARKINREKEKSISTPESTGTGQISIIGNHSDTHRPPNA